MNFEDLTPAVLITGLLRAESGHPSPTAPREETLLAPVLVASHAARTSASEADPVLGKLLRAAAITDAHAQSQLESTE